MYINMSISGAAIKTKTRKDGNDVENYAPCHHLCHTDETDNETEHACPASHADHGNGGGDGRFLHGAID